MNWIEKCDIADMRQTEKTQVYREPLILFIKWFGKQWETSLKKIGGDGIKNRDGMF